MSIDTRNAFFAPVFLVALLAALLAPGSAVQAQASDARRPGVIEAGVSGIDFGIKPGDDFFAYANGAWLKTTDIPAGKARWTVRGEIAELTRQPVVGHLSSAQHQYHIG
jgi:putative endopeptidase